MRYKYVVLSGPRGERALSRIADVLVPIAPRWYYVEASVEPLLLKGALEAMWAGRRWLSIKIARPVDEIIYFQSPRQAAEAAAALAKEKGVRRACAKARGRGSGVADAVYAALKEALRGLGIKTTGHSGRVHVVRVDLWPLWLYKRPGASPLPRATISVYPKELEARNPYS